MKVVSKRDVIRRLDSLSRKLVVALALAILPAILAGRRCERIVRREEGFLTAAAQQMARGQALKNPALFKGQDFATEFKKSDLRQVKK